MNNVKFTQLPSRVQVFICESIIAAIDEAIVQTHVELKAPPPTDETVQALRDATIAHCEFFKE